MHTKLTLRTDESLIKLAKTCSTEHGKSLSPITQELKGILKSKKISKKDYYKYLENKYL